MRLASPYPLPPSPTGKEIGRGREVKGNEIKGTGRGEDNDREKSDRQVETESDEWWDLFSLRDKVYIPYKVTQHDIK